MPERQFGWFLAYHSPGEWPLVEPGCDRDVAFCNCDGELAAESTVCLVLLIELRAACLVLLTLAGLAVEVAYCYIYIYILYILLLVDALPTLELEAC